ncbi:hypothetical protein PPYR_06360 [Photinus pyralis]|uniref:Uncharacterized protein n=1 Tax=Photinus pyralis TaxID=7054 RepID=A0A5N4ATS1_PHOPY|nr:uncharacterized protein LOC116166404 [Photinus pyralis]KAB0800620.1 hypothetical protein PPYR_06360 [Photinus pyralis]
MEKHSKLRALNKNEEEIYCVNYDEVSNSPPICSNDVSQSIGLSIEVEIADSLKNVMSRPEKHNSSLLDVTIVRPNHLNRFSGKQSVTIRGSEIQDLILRMEKQKREKELLIADLKRVQDTRITKKHEKKRKPNLNAVRSNNAVASDNKTKRISEEKPFVNSAPTSILQPLMGQIRESLRHLEERILAVGDHKENITQPKAQPHSLLNCDLVDALPRRKQTKKHMRKLQGNVHERNHHVYTTVHTFDRLKTLLSCQNANARDVEDDKPCPCQHCGMVQLLVESQKRPIMPTLPLKTPSGVWPQTENREDQESSETSLEDPYNIIRELALRLRALEERVALQERSTVPKDYFKRVIKRILDLQATISQRNQCDVGAHTAGTQYNFNQSEEFDRRSRSKIRQRNVQIQQGYAKRYYVSPMLEESSSQKIFSAISSLFPNLNYERINDCFLKWGKEAINPGADLKAKIIDLLDEKLLNSSNLKETLKPSTSSGETLRKLLELLSTQDKLPTGVDNEVDFSKLSSEIGKPNLARGVLDKHSKRHRSGIPIRIGNISVGDACISTPKNETRSARISKLKTNKMDKDTNADEAKLTSEHVVRVTYVNPHVKTWKDLSSNSEAEVLTGIQEMSLRSSSSFQLHSANTENKEQPTRLLKNYSLSEKLKLLKKVASSEITKLELWTYIWNQTKTYCKSKDDTIIVQVPTRKEKGHAEIIEVEFTIEDVQQLVENPKLLTTKRNSNHSSHPKSVKSLLLIKRKTAVNK